MSYNHFVGQEIHITNNEFYVDYIYIGNTFDLNNTPEQLKDYYTRTVNKQDIKKVYIIRNTVKKVNQVFIITKDCSDVFLRINKHIDKYIDHNQTKEYRVIYYLNCESLTNDDIYKLLRIKKKQIKNFHIDVIDCTLNVYIETNE